jgi:copper(I)-binding protein
MPRSLLLAAFLLSATISGALALDPAPAGVVEAGDLAISDAYARATLPNAPVGGGYLTVTNKGAEADRLVSAASPASREVQLHESQVVDGVMRMREVAGGIAIPAGESVVLAPGGNHLMFMGLNGPLVEGESVPVTLVFSRAGSVEVSLAIASFGAAAPAGGHDAQGAMPHRMP